MGQSNSRASETLNYVILTKQKLLATIIALNSRCEDSLQQSNVNMIFAAERLVDNEKYFDILQTWKKTVKIRCFSVMNGRTYSRTYSLINFLKLYNTLKQMLDASDVSHNPTQEEVDDRLMQMFMFKEEWCTIEGKCIICMDRKPNAVLPCAHAFCDRCINAFLNIRQTCCPLCRHKLNASTALNKAWVMAEIPTRDSINAYMIDGGTADVLPNASALTSDNSAHMASTSTTAATAMKSISSSSSVSTS